MPIMVMDKVIPMIRCMNAVYNPPHSNHTRLNKTEMQPVLLPSLITLRPNGHSTNSASLKHCNPQGIPMMVIHKTTPPNK